MSKTEQQWEDEAQAEYLRQWVNREPARRRFREKVVAVCFVGMVVIALLAAFCPEWVK